MTIATSNVSTTTSPIYTSSGNTAITWLSLANYGVGNVTANVHVVPSGGTMATPFRSMPVPILQLVQLLVTQQSNGLLR